MILSPQIEPRKIEPRRIAKVVIIKNTDDFGNLILDSDSWKVLILQRVKGDRRPESEQGLDFTGGNVRRSESFRQGAVREVREETELRIQENDLIFLKQQELGSGYGYIHWFVTTYPGGEVNLEPKEHEEYYWIKVGQLRKVAPYPPKWMMRLIRLGVVELESHRFN